MNKNVRRLVHSFHIQAFLKQKKKITKVLLVKFKELLIKPNKRLQIRRNYNLRRSNNINHNLLIQKMKQVLFRNSMTILSSLISRSTRKQRQG